MLKETYLLLLKNYNSNNILIHELWVEIETNYTNPKRHYHTLKHLENLLNQLTVIKPEIKDWDTMLFTLFYHDLVYNALKSDNEEQSALIAEKRMTLVGVPQTIIDNCKKQILATKTHLDDLDNDTNVFTDADLSILGQDWETYSGYYKSVRKEYSLYPDLIYNPGRKQVLKHFLNMERIYKTDYFYLRFEEQAKGNLLREMEML